MKNSISIILIIGTALIFCSCLSITNNKFPDILRNQSGTLFWSGSPARDGAGILFETSDTIYGAPGTRDNYSDYFPKDKNQIQIKADIYVTGNITTRGWGSEFPEIKFLKIKPGDHPEQ